MAHYTGGCLCGTVRYSIDAEPTGHHSRIAPDCALRTASREFRLVDRVTRALGAERQKGVPKRRPFHAFSLIREILKYFVRRLSGCVTVTYSY